MKIIAKEDFNKFVNSLIADDSLQVIGVKAKIIIGVHPYDIVALLHMDEVFRETKSVPYYFDKRNSSIIIGVNIQKMPKWCFAPFMGCATVEYGYDLMLTDLGNRYAI